MNKSTSALSVQIGGDHYKSCAIQPVQYIEANKLQFLEACVVKRVTRHDKPTGKGRQDIEKAIHELQLVLELRYPEAQGKAQPDGKMTIVDADGWAEWQDGPYLPPTGQVEVQYRDGTGDIMDASIFNWSHVGRDRDIVKWRK